MVLCLRSPGLNFVATRVRKGGDGLKPSISKMYFCDRDFNVYTLPLKFNGDFVKPEKMR